MSSPSLPVIASSQSAALRFELHATVRRARAATIYLPHGPVPTPIFMPVGTTGTIKGLTVKQIKALDIPLILGNTYHLGNRPGPDIMRAMGGLHKFMGYNGNILTDSGGFQMVSLLELAEVTEEGVKFQSPHGKGEMMLTPEESMQIQAAIGADIIMALDDVVSTTTTGPRVREAMERSVRWLDRCIEAHKNTDRQNLFAIIQGGVDEQLRADCLREMIARDLPGYAIGGLSGGEHKDLFWRTVRQCCDALPQDKPRYLMGVGYDVDMVVSVLLGVDHFDCVAPTRTARFACALMRSEGSLQLRNARFATDFRVLDETCQCATCAGGYTRSFLHHAAAKNELGAQLLTIHNLYYQRRLLDDMREAILAGEGALGDFVRKFMHDRYSALDEKEYPRWIVDACREAGIELPAIEK